MNYVLVLARVIFSLIFVMSGLSHFGADSIAYAASSGVPMAKLMVPASGIIALLGGLSIILGYKAKWGAWLIVMFLVPVTFMMHAFWKVSDPMMHQMQMISFMKNLSLIGGALFIANFGAGEISLDSKLSK